MQIFIGSDLMKQELTGYLYNLKNKIKEISHYLYDYPEESFKERNSSDYITELLSHNNFSITKNFMNIPNAFQAQFGEGHPKICFLCEYDGDSKKGHICGNNLLTAISLTSAVALSNVINKTKGSIVVIGTPGELQGGSKVTMEKQEAFSDLDTIMLAKPYTLTVVDSNCQAILPLKIVFFENDRLKITPEDANLFIINFLAFFLKSLNYKCGISNLSLIDKELKFDIKTESMELASEMRNKIELISDTIEKLTGLKQEVSLSNLPCSEFTKSTTLNRLFSNNLKECGIIDMKSSNCNELPSTLGCVSKRIPCINAYICITENKDTKYPSEEFAKKTLEDYAEDIAFKTAQALAFTALDLLEKQELITEAKIEISNNI